MSTDYILNVVTVLTNCDHTVADFVKKLRCGCLLRSGLEFVSPGHDIALFQEGIIFTGARRNLQRSHQQHR